MDLGFLIVALAFSAAAGEPAEPAPAEVVRLPRATIVDLGDESECTPDAKAASTRPKGGPTVPRSSVRPEDPEQARTVLKDDEPPASRKPPPVRVSPARKNVSKPGDPEQAQAFPKDEAPALKVAAARASGGSTPKNTGKPGDPERAQGFPEDDGPALTEKVAYTPDSSISKEASKPDDPEQAQVLPEDDAQAPAEPVTLAPGGPVQKSTSKPGDPEQPRFCPREDEADPGLADSVQPNPQSAIRNPQSDEPRFYSGEGLDGDAAAIVADGEMPNPGPQSTSPNPQSEDPSPQSAIPSPQLDGQNPQSATRNPQSADPEQRVKELMEEIKRNNEILRKMSAEASDTKVRGPNGEDSGLRVRDPRAARIMEALLKDAPLGSVSGIVTDATGRQLVPARIRVTDITETCLQAPLAEGFWCPGRFSAPVMSGPVRVEVSRGRFNSTFVQGLQVKAGMAASLQPAAIARPAALNFAAQGWYLADLDMGLRVQPGERAVWLGDGPDLDTLLLAAQAEGVQILGVPLPWGESSTEREVEALAAASSEVLLLPVLPGPRHAFYGCGMGLGLKSWERHFALPVREYASPEGPLCEAFEAIRACGGLAVYKNPGGGKLVDIRHDIYSLFPRLEKAGFYPQGSSTARLYAANELPFDTLAGPAYDLIVLDGTASAEQFWFNLLSQGYNVGAIGAGGGSLEGGRLPYGQTFVAVEGALARDKVVAAIRQGRTTVSFGPAVFCRILERDKGPGTELAADGRTLTLQIQAYSSMGESMQLDKIEVIRNGEVVHEQAASEGQTQVNNMCWTISETASAWYVVRVTERCNTPSSGHKPGTAWTNAIHFRGPGYAPRAPARSRITGTLRRGPNPVAGTVTAVVTGQPPRQISTDKNGNYKIELPVSGSLLFEAPGCEPLAQRVFEHPRVQRALGALQAEREGALRQQLQQASLLPAWRLLLADLEWDVTLLPERAALFEAPKGSVLDRLGAER